MNIKPHKEKILEELSIKQTYTILIAITAIILAIGAFISLQNGMIITLVCLAVISLFNIKRIIDRIKLAKVRITDISNSELNLTDASEDNYLYCHQTVKDTYEVCDIYLPEVDSIIEDNKRGFYIKLKEDRTYSKIKIDDTLSKTSIFKVNGEQYNYDEFLDFYSMLIDEVDKIEQAPKKNWQDEDKKKEFIKLLLPYSIMLVMLVIHIFVGNI